jgi:hypothetical protein
VPFAQLPGRYSDASVAVDARFVGTAQGQYIDPTCRATAAGRYALWVRLDTGEFRLVRLQGCRPTDLARGQASGALPPGNATNRLKLTCAGDAISATLNGTQVAAVRDGIH